MSKEGPTARPVVPAPQRMPGRVTAPRRLTSNTISAGVAVGAFCFAVAFVAEIAGVAPGPASMTDLGAVMEGLPALTPWAWASLGTFAILLTPAAGLLATTWEYVSIGDRRGVALATAVLAVLAFSAGVAILR